MSPPVGAARSGVVGTKVGNAIPDSVVYLWDTQDAFTASNDGNQVTTWTDEVAGISATGTGATVVSSGINGFRSLDVDDVDDGFTVDDATLQDLSEWTVIAVAEPQFAATVSNDRSLFHRDSGNDIFIEWASGNDNWLARIDGTNNVIGTSTLGTKLFTLTGDANGGVLREEGTQTGSEANAAVAIQDLSIGFLSGVGRHFGGYIGHLEFHNTRLTGTALTDREQTIADKWGITI